MVLTKNLGHLRTDGCVYVSLFLYCILVLYHYYITALQHVRCLEHAWMDLCHTNTILTDQLIPPKSDKFRYFADGWKEAPRHYLPASSSSWQSAEGIPGSNSCPDPRHPGSLHTHQHHSNKHQCATQHTCSSSNTFSKLLLSPGDNWE